MTPKLQIWTDAARPKTLAAAVVPVIAGTSLAMSQGFFEPFASAVALICAMLIQVGTNFANDYYDFVKGADTQKRVGFPRAVSKGLVSPESMKRATILTMALAFFTGLYLVWHGGWVILLIGILSIIFGILYTGGPFPLGYNGLGDLFVFIFFGFIATMGTFYINTFEWSMLAFWASISVGALCVNILVVNNLRDVEEDKKTGKRTLGVLFGEKALKIEYVLMLLLAFAIPPHFFVQEGFTAGVLLPLITFPLAAHLAWTVWTETEKANLNKTLERTAQFMLIFGVLSSIGYVLGG